MQHLAVEVEHGAAEGGVIAEVDADDLERRAVEVEQGGRLAGAGVLALADLHDEALDDELGDKVGDRDAGESGLAGDVGAGLLAGPVEGLQHERAVVSAGVLRQHLGGGSQCPAGREPRCHVC